MEKLAVLVANGQRPNHPKIMQILKDAEEIICVDNGYEIVQKLNNYPRQVRNVAFIDSEFLLVRGSSKRVG